MQIGISDHELMVGRKRKTRGAEKRPTTLYVGQWIRALGRKPAEVVRETGINEGYLSELSSGRKTNPSSAVLLEIANFLGIPMQYFYQAPPDRDFLAEAERLDPAVLARLMAPKP